MRPLNLGQSTLVRWGVGIAALLIAQSLILGGLFWQLTSARQEREIARELREDCAQLAAMTPQDRLQSIGGRLRADVHRQRFLAAFGAGGERLAGNLAHAPDGLQPGGRGDSGIVTASVEPTRLPGVSRDVARLILCQMPDRTVLVSGMDLDQATAVSDLITRALGIGLLLALLIAAGGGWLAASQARRRFDAVRHFSEQITDGDLGKRLPVSRHPDSFGMLCAQINAMLDRIEALMEDVKGVGDDIAHQLRTPLTRLRARLEREMGTASTPEEFACASSRALAEIDQSLGMVAALLRIREIDDRSRRQNFTSVSLNQLVADVVELYGPMAEARHNDLALEIIGTVSLRGDRDLLMEALSNLVDNAIKYARAETRIVVRLDGGVTPLITVTNEADEIGSADHETLFRRFRRGRNAIGVEGVGLGLSLVKAICELHHAIAAIERSAASVVIATLAFPGAEILREAKPRPLLR